MDCLCSQITPRDGVSSCPCVSSHQKSLDRFVVAHLLGWWGKTLMIRDPYVCHVVSFLFEILEYMFTFVQPNFAECWWDHVRTLVENNLDSIEHAMHRVERVRGS